MISWRNRSSDLTNVALWATASNQPAFASRFGGYIGFDIQERRPIRDIYIFNLKHLSRNTSEPGQSRARLYSAAGVPA